MDDRQLIEDLLSALEYHTEQTRPIQFSNVAMEAAREYLSKPAQQECRCNQGQVCHICDPITPPAQQKPVAWVLEWTFNGEERGRRLYDDETHCVFDAENDGGVCKPLVYGDTSPPAQRKPLDAGEISRLWKQHTSEDGPHHNPYDDDGLGFARAIEAKLKEKNT